MEVGFIGLGLMGRPMALNLLKAGHRLHVWSRREASLRPLLDAGASGCDSARAVAAAAEVVISMVADAPDVEKVSLGPDGVADGARSGTIFIDMSTIAPSAARSISGRLATRGVTMLDAPVSGGEAGAIAGTLTIMVGGPGEAFRRALPLFEAMGGKTTHIDEKPGAGQVAKACNQVITGVGVASLAEALNFARKSGVDPAAVRQVLMGGLANSRILENHGQRMVERNFAPGFKSWMHLKDIRIVLSEGHALQVPLPAAAAAAQMYSAMLGCGLGEEDSVAMLKLFEAMSGAGADMRGEQ